MSQQREAAKQKQQEFEELEEGRTENSAIQDCFRELCDAYDKLMDEDSDPGIRHDYLRLCLYSLAKFKHSEIHNLDYYTTSMWREMIASDDLPDELETQLLQAVEDGLLKELTEVRLLADIFAKDEHYAKAIRYYEALSAGLDNESSWDKWAGCYAQQDNFAAAVEVLTHGLERFPDSQFLGSNRGFYLYKDNRNKEALAQLEQVIQLAETGKYTGDRHYRYAINLKASIFRELYMPLQALIEYSRLSTAGNCDRDEVLELGQLMVPHVEDLRNE